MTLKPSALGRGRRTAQRTTRTEVTPAGSEWEQLRSHAIHRLHEAIDEIPVLFRRVKIVLLVGAATMALFAAGVLVLLAKAIR
jgi:hypothetical protein